MSKYLSWIQTIAKVGKIVCKVLFILCLVGAIGSLVGLVSILALETASLLDLGFLSEEKGENFFSLSVFSCINGVITCVGMAILTRMGERYLENEMKAGTPFTEEGSRELFRFGIATLIVSAATSVASSIALGIVSMISGTWFDSPDFASASSIEFGLLWLLLSLVFRYGAELRAQLPTPEQKEEEKSDEETTQETMNS